MIDGMDAMNDVAACEQRLGMALDRIDYGLDRLFQRMRAAEPAPAEDAVPARLAESGAEAARLAEANDALIAANRALIAAGDAPGRADAERQALDAEIEALRAARAAELAQMGELLAALESMLGLPETPPLPADNGEAGPADQTEER